MAVYTSLERAEIEEFLTRYDAGELLSFKGIAEGVENSNFFLLTTQGKFILTLFEKRMSESDLPYFTGLMEYLSDKGIDCPRPLRDRVGEMIQKLKGKSALIVTFVEGTGFNPESPLAHHPDVAKLLGKFCAELQIAAKDYRHERANSLALAGWETLAKEIGVRAEDIEPGLGALIEDELAYLKRNWPQGLPQGPVHADLFPDNVFYMEAGGALCLSGVIDLYFACNDMWMYDFAICLNAWAWAYQSDSWHFLPEFAKELVRAYDATRAHRGEAVIAAEKDALAVLCRGAALRFLLTRTYDWLNHPPGALVTPKNPKEYIAKLRYWRELDR